MTRRQKSRIGGGVFSLTFAVFAGMGAFYTIPFTSDSDQYYHLSVTLANPPEVVKAYKQPDGIKFIFKEYPGIYFDADVNNCDYYISGFNPNDTANIQVLKEEYRRIIMHKGNFFERLVSKKISLYGFIYNKKDYVNFRKIKTDNRDQFIYNYIFYLVVLFFFFAGIDGIFNNKR